MLCIVVKEKNYYLNVVFQNKRRRMLRNRARRRKIKIKKAFYRRLFKGLKELNMDRGQGLDRLCI